jgi:hypothetical protein
VRRDGRMGREFRWASISGARSFTNGRHGYDRGWTYQSSVVNLAWVDEFDPEIFNGRPAVVSDHRSDLW